MNFYTGIGARDTGADVLGAMTRIAEGLAELGWTLRSGGARGADSTFEAGARKGGGSCEIYLPWNGFNPEWTPGQEHDPKAKRWASQPGVIVGDDEAFERAANVALKVWPRDIPWHRMKSGTRKLQSRNSFQLLGLELDTPSAFVLYWSESDGSGSTGQALRLARHYAVPTYRVGPLDTARSITDWLAAQAAQRLELDVRDQTRDEERHWSEWDDPGGREVSTVGSFDHYAPEVFDNLYDD